MPTGRLQLNGNQGLYQVPNDTNVPVKLIDAGTGEWVGPIGPSTVVPSDISLAGLSVPGRSAATAGGGGNLTGTADQVLRVNTAGTTLGFGTLASGAYGANSVNSAAMDDNLIHYATGSLNTAAVLALSSSPATLIAAPGANKVLVLSEVTLQYVYNTTAFTIGSATNLQVKYTNGSGAAASATQAVTGMLDQSSNQIRLLPMNSSSITPVANAALVLHLAGADVTGGAGSINYYITYRIHTVA